MLLRDKLLGQLLEIYVHSINPDTSSMSQSQCLVNQPADDLLEILLMKNDMKYMLQSVAPLLKVEQPPRL